MRFLSLFFLTVVGCLASASSSEEDLFMGPFMGAFKEKGIVRTILDDNTSGEGVKLNVKIDGDEEINPLSLLSGAMSTMLQLLPQLPSAKVKTSQKVSGGQFSPSRQHILDTILGKVTGVAFGMEQLSGPHICVREINKKLGKEFGSTYERSCENFPQAVRCVKIRHAEDEAIETTRIQECCSGFTTEDIVRNGCDKEITAETLEGFLSYFNVSQSPSSLNISYPYTILISEQAPEKMAIFSERLMDYDLHNAQQIKAKDGQNYLIRQPENEKTTYLNCVPLVKTNVFLPDGVAMVSQNFIRPAGGNVLEMMEKDGRFKIFLSILSENVKSKLSSSDSSVTVMPFSDEAFEKFPKTLQEQIRSKQRCATTVIERSHIFQPATCSRDLSSAETHATFFFSKKNIRVGDANIVESDLVALNGIVHVVDDVILKNELMPWQDKLNTTEPLLASLLAGEIDDNQPVTIFLPLKHNISEMSKEEALNQVIPWYLPSLKSLPPTVTTMANSTIFAGKFPMAAGFSFRMKKTKSIGEEEMAQIGCSRLMVHPESEEKHLSACGSSIFFLDKPLPRVIHTMEEFLKSRSDISRFANLFTVFSSNHTLPKVSTLFVPVDDAFALNHYRKLRHNSEGCVKLVQTHLVARPICDYNLKPCTDEIRKEIITNKNGDNLNVEKVENIEVAIEGSKILETVVVSNGVVHLIENIIRKESSSSSHGIRSSLFDFNA